MRLGFVCRLAMVSAGLLLPATFTPAGTTAQGLAGTNQRLISSQHCRRLVTEAWVLVRSGRSIEAGNLNFEEVVECFSEEREANRFMDAVDVLDARLDAQPGGRYGDWMTGTFNSGVGLMQLSPSGGSYADQNGRMSVTNIELAQMDGIWEQDTSPVRCQNGRYWGRFRLTFTETDFAGGFGYCDQEPNRLGRFRGTRMR